MDYVKSPLSSRVLLRIFSSDSSLPFPSISPTTSTRMNELRSLMGATVPSMPPRWSTMVACDGGAAVAWLDEWRHLSLPEPLVQLATSLTNSRTTAHMRFLCLGETGQLHYVDTTYALREVGTVKWSAFRQGTLTQTQPVRACAMVPQTTDIVLLYDDGTVAALAGAPAGVPMRPDELATYLLWEVPAAVTALVDVTDHVVTVVDVTGAVHACESNPVFLCEEDHTLLEQGVRTWRPPCPLTALYVLGSGVYWFRDRTGHWRYCEDGVITARPVPAFSVIVYSRVGCDAVLYLRTDGRLYLDRGVAGERERPLTYTPATWTLDADDLPRTPDGLRIREVALNETSPVGRPALLLRTSGDYIFAVQVSLKRGHGSVMQVRALPGRKEVCG